MTDPKELAALIGRTLTARGGTLATSESLTGGLLGAVITDVPGSSAYYLGGVIVYATELKLRISGVGSDTVAQYGVISEQAVTEMALGIQDLTGADWVIATSGVAGPGSQEGHLPGEVWLCIVGPRIGAQVPGPMALRYNFAGDRDSVRRQAVAVALELLVDQLSPVVD